MKRTVSESTTGFLFSISFCSASLSSTAFMFHIFMICFCFYIKPNLVATQMTTYTFCGQRQYNKGDFSFKRNTLGFFNLVLWWSNQFRNWYLLSFVEYERAEPSENYKEFLFSKLPDINFESKLKFTKEIEDICKQIT